MLYICIYNEKTKEIRWPEEYEYDTVSKIRWANMNYDRLDCQARAYGGDDWHAYRSEEKQFEFAVEAKK